MGKSEKEVKKYLIYHWIYKHSSSLKELSLKAIHTFLLDEGDHYASLALDLKHSDSQA